MLYDAYEVQRSLLAGASSWPISAPDGSTTPPIPAATSRWGRSSPPRLEVFAHAAAPRGKPEFGIDTRRWSAASGRGPRGGRAPQAVRPAQAFREKASKGGPQLLMVAPMSGHYATLLRGTVERLLPGPRRLHHRLARREAGAADGGQLRSRRLCRLSDRIPRAHRRTGKRPHMLAVCQPSVPAYAAAALMSADKKPGGRRR